MSRIRELCQEAGNPAPAFSESGDFVDIEFHRTEVVERGVMGGSIGGAIGGSIHDEVAQTELTARQLDVLNLIKLDPQVPYRKMAEELGINDSAVKKHLDKLKEAGAIVRIGGTRGYWKVKV